MFADKATQLKQVVSTDLNLNKYYCDKALTDDKMFYDFKRKTLRKMTNDEIKRVANLPVYKTIQPSPKQNMR